MESSVKFDRKLNILVAFPYFTKQILEEIESMNRDEYRLIVDSGAFTAYNTGEEIKLDDYCKFIRHLQDRNINLESYVQLDVVFNELETIKNYKIMLERGFDPAPVFTRGSDENYFHELCEMGKYVFVGGVQKGINNRNFAKWILNHSQKYKVHLLAFIKPEYLNMYQPYSVDSSSWSSTSRFGTIQYYNNGRIRVLNKSDFKNGAPPEFVAACERIGINKAMISCLQFNDSWSSFLYRGEPISKPTAIKGLAQFITIAHWIYYSIQAQNKIKTKIYMAIGAQLHLSIFNAAYKHLKRVKAI